MNNKNKDKVRLKNAGAFFLTPCYRTPAASGLTQDLHDYKDVAENYDRYLDVMYSEGMDHHENFQEFYLKLAKKYGSDGVVDVACGTGAVLLYLAERGIIADGTDISEEMCKVAGAKADKMNTTPEDYSFRLEYVNADGNREKIYNAISYNPYTQQMYGNWKFETYNEAGEIIGERVRPLLMRQTYRSEMFLLAELCGFEVLDIYRGYNGDKEDLNDPSSAAKYRSNLIWILKRN